MKLITVILLSLVVFTGCKKDDDDEQIVLPTAEQYITWQIGNTKGEFIVPTDTVTAARSTNFTEILAFSPSNNNSVSFSFNGAQTSGNYNSNLTMTINGETYLPSNDPIRVTVTQFGNIGDFIVGSYTGELRDDEFKRYAIRGWFKIRLRQ